MGPAVTGMWGSTQAGRQGWLWSWQHTALLLLEITSDSALVTALGGLHLGGWWGGVTSQMSQVRWVSVGGGGM